MVAVLRFSGSVALGQEAECAPVSVGDDTGVYLLVLGGSCTLETAGGYHIVQHLVRDDETSEVLVLIDDGHLDGETIAVADVLAESIKGGAVDGETWHTLE